LFLLWAQLHPGYLLGLGILLGWILWNWTLHPEFRKRETAWLLLPFFAVVLNPEGWAGAVYPLRFALNEAETLKKFNLEWLPTYHPLFRFRPESLAYYMLSLLSLFVVYRDKLWKRQEGVFALLLIALGLKTVRFAPFSSLALILTLKPWLKLNIHPKFEKAFAWLALAAMIAASANNLMNGYRSTSGLRTPGFELDPTRFPLNTFEVLFHNPIQGRLYNSGSLSGYLIWKQHTPVFNHGFVTDMQFLEHEVAQALQSPEVFFELAKKYDWKMLLIDKGTEYHYFYQVLSPHPEWKIVAEDGASYLIYLNP
jgi:hypothetical protein